MALELVIVLAYCLFAVSMCANEEDERFLLLGLALLLLLLTLINKRMPAHSIQPADVRRWATLGL